MKRFVKDSNANEDYQINWVNYLGSDTISTSTWVADHPLWTALTAYKAGDRVRLAGGAILDVSVAGTSAGSPPSAPAAGSTVVDGTVTWLRSFNIESSNFTTTMATVWVSGGMGREYSLINHMTSVGGRQEDEMLVFMISEE